MSNYGHPNFSPTAASPSFLPYPLQQAHLFASLAVYFNAMPDQKALLPQETMSSEAAYDDGLIHFQEPPQVLIQDGPEVLPHLPAAVDARPLDSTAVEIDHGRLQTDSVSKDSRQALRADIKPSRFCGIATTRALVIALVVVIITAAVAGGVGGSLAVKQAEE
jgi:hypothetical protein